MKIYQIIASEGFNDDYACYVMGNYLHKTKAEAEMKRLENEVQRVNPCNGCPYLSKWFDKPIDTECQSHKPIIISEEPAELWDCENKVSRFDLDPTYEICELDVDENVE